MKDWSALQMQSFRDALEEAGRKNAGFKGQVFT